MGDILLPDVKRKLWTLMSEDLAQYAPAFYGAELLLCPVCCRALRYEQFSLEHILPQQAVKNDPADVRDVINKNQRSGLTLLCKETIIVGNRSFPNGCNGWKGRNFDARVSELLKPDPFPRFTNTHTIALLVVGYLGLFKQYGYRVALTEDGLIARNQFFSHRRFVKKMPLTSQMVLRGSPKIEYDPSMHAYWSEPVQISVENGKAIISIRNQAVLLPLTSDPRVPIAKNLVYAPSKYVFRPDLRIAFA